MACQHAQVSAIVALRDSHQAAETDDVYISVEHLFELLVISRTSQSLRRHRCSRDPHRWRFGHAGVHFRIVLGADVDPRIHGESARAGRSMAAASGIRNDEFAALLADAQIGAEPAITRLFEDMQPRLLRFLGAADPSSGEDLAADVWLAVATSLPRFRGGYQAFRSWVFAIARRRLVDHRRSIDRRRTDPSDEEAFVSIIARDQTDRQVVDRLSGRDAALAITQMLSEEQAEVVLLRIVAELDVAEVASIMEKTENWVRVTQHRALRKLSDRLGDSREVIL